MDTEIPQLAPEKARFHVLPVPYEKTVSYGHGTALGPGAIIAASGQLERWDGSSDPGAEGVYTWPAIDCSGEPANVIEEIATAVARILALRKLPVVLGGEHTVTWGVMQGYFKAGMRDFGVVQIDAHADLRDAYEGDPLSHASVMRRIVEAAFRSCSSASALFARRKSTRERSMAWSRTTL
jgi:agmatinase